MLRSFWGKSACEIKSLPQQMYEEKEKCDSVVETKKEVLWHCSLVITMRKTSCFFVTPAFAVTLHIVCLLGCSFKRMFLNTIFSTLLYQKTEAIEG